MEIFDQYKKLAESLVSKINAKFSNITFLTIDEIIKEEIDLRSTWWELSKIQDYSYSESKKVNIKLENLSEEDYDDWGYEIENKVHDLHNLIDWKVMSLQTLIDALSKIVDLEEEDEILKHFQDIKPIEL